MRQLFGFLIVVLMLCCMDARAGDDAFEPEEGYIPMEDHYRGPDFDFLRNMFFEIIGEQMVAKFRPGTGREVFRENFAKFFGEWINPKLSLDQNIERYVADAIHVGYADLNDDGVDELLVSFETSLSCGTAGCSSNIFAKKAGQWVEIADWSTAGVVVTDERIGGYHTLKSDQSGVRWSLAKEVYVEFCIASITNIGHADDSCE